jgi:biofilm PGA synthesis N-glycosyltransferase PgaC
LLFVSYSTLILFYWQSWRSVPGYVPDGDSAKTKISVIIPARNEEENIIPCLESVCDQNYPPELLQIIVLDDCSTDKTWERLQNFYHPEREVYSVQLTEVENAEFSGHKKRAIQTGITMAHGELIVTTDADCKHPAEWIKNIASFYEEEHAVFIAAPVVFENNTSFLQIFQALDFLILQGITGASVYKNIHSMCNGANLAYEKKVFYEVNGFAGVDHIASGDDMLLMHKIWKKHPHQVYYLKSKNAIVTTQPMKTWKTFFNQRIRWASKAKQYDDKRILVVLLLVYFFNLSFLVLLVAGFFNYHYWLYLAGLWVAKTMVEFPFVNSVAIFFGKQSLMKYFFFFQPLHIFYTIVSGFLGQFGKYEWKGRKVK